MSAGKIHLRLDLYTSILIDRCVEMEGRREEREKEREPAVPTGGQRSV